jgi:RimJ/RimL family protein N-acetyltransferase
MSRHHLLADGTPVLLRPLLPGDRFELAAAYADLSLQARRLRFFAPADELPDSDLAYLTRIDYHDHFAWAALLERGPWPRGIGVGRYIRDRLDPTAAEVAVTVVEAYQHRGLGTLLTRSLADVAVANGIRTFVSYVLWDNDVVVDGLQGQGARVTAAEPGDARIELDLPAPPTELGDPYVHRVLRTFAEGLREFVARIQREVAARG